jgi:hypothetical protein
MPSTDKSQNLGFPKKKSGFWFSLAVNNKILDNFLDFYLISDIFYFKIVQKHAKIKKI